jgi:hypothetical protein
MIGLTADMRHDARETLLQSGAVAVLPKPHHLSQLIRVVGQVCAQQV